MMQLSSTVGDFDVRLDSIREKVMALGATATDDTQSIQQRIKELGKKLESLVGILDVVGASTYAVR